jgi:acyl-CoA dehydrogenase
VPHQERWRKQQHVDRALWRKGGELGILLADVPDEYGGSGGNFAHQAVVFEELSYAGDMAFGMHVHAIVAHYILNQGTEAQKRKYLPLLASGEMVAAIAMSEPGAGSDLKGIRTTAVAAPDGYRVNGSKTFISNGYLADLIVVVVKTDPAAGAKGVSLLLLETKDNPGFRVGRILEKVGQKGQDTCELFFDDAHVALDNVLGGVEGRGFAQLMTELPYERTILGVAGVAAIERALKLTVEHTRERKAFRPGADRHAEHPLRAGRDQDRGHHRAHLHRPLHRGHGRRRMDTVRLRWPSTGSPTCSARWSTSACSCSAATATCSNTRSHRCMWTRACSASTAAPMRS